MNEIVVTVPGIHCQGCVNTIQANLTIEEGIDQVEGDPKTNTIRVSYRPDVVTPNEIEMAIARLGFVTK